jgi:hypothetical protein
MLESPFCAEERTVIALIELFLKGRNSSGRTRAGNRVGPFTFFNRPACWKSCKRFVPCKREKQCVKNSFHTPGRLLLRKFMFLRHTGKFARDKKNTRCKDTLRWKKSVKIIVCNWKGHSLLSRKTILRRCLKFITSFTPFWYELNYPRKRHRGDLKTHVFIPFAIL